MKAAGSCCIEEVIDPRDTRRLVCEWVENAYRLASQPDRLGPRAIQFRPERGLLRATGNRRLTRGKPGLR